MKAIRIILYILLTGCYILGIIGVAINNQLIFYCFLTAACIVAFLIGFTSDIE